MQTLPSDHLPPAGLKAGAPRVTDITTTGGYFTALNHFSLYSAGSNHLSSAKLGAQVCHDCVVVATSARTELSPLPTKKRKAASTRTTNTHILHALKHLCVLTMKKQLQRTHVLFVNDLRSCTKHRVHGGSCCSSNITARPNFDKVHL